jgi:hypothetical protein
MNKAALLAELRTMLHDVFAARNSGVSHPKLARAHGYVDGYMKALLDSGLATKQDLLALVAEQRSATSGPATTEVALEPDAA